MPRTDPEGNALPPEAFAFGNDIGQSISSVKTAWQATCDQAGIVDLHFPGHEHQPGEARCYRRHNPQQP